MKKKNEYHLFDFIDIKTNKEYDIDELIEKLKKMSEESKKKLREGEALKLFFNKFGEVYTYNPEEINLRIRMCGIRE